MMTIEEDLAATGSACDARFEALQPAMVAAFRAQGVPEAEIPEALAYAHGEYWRERTAQLARLRGLLERAHNHPHGLTREPARDAGDGD